MTRQLRRLGGLLLCALVLTPLAAADANADDRRIRVYKVTAEGSGKLRSLEADPHLNLSYYKDRTREWISVSGLATISRDRQKIRELYAPDWKMWFPDEGDARHGTPDDPRLVLIGVAIHAAVFLEVNKPQPVVLYEVVKGWLTGTEPEIGKMHTLKP